MFKVPRMNEEITPLQLTPGCDDIDVKFEVGSRLRDLKIEAVLSKELPEAL